MNNPKKILIIEDNTDIRETATEIIELANYAVFSADNGKTGLDISVREVPDVILCDIMMPELDGFEVLHLLSKNPKTNRIPFIFMTAKGERTDMRKGMEMGADDYLTKPFTAIELLNSIECQLRKKDKLLAATDGQVRPAGINYTGVNGADLFKQQIAGRKPRNLRRKQIVYYQGDPATGIYLVLSGSVKTFKVAEDGREFSTGFYRKDEYFGMAAMLSGDEYSETAEALEESSVCFLPKSSIEDLIGKYPDVAAGFIKVLAGTVVNHEEQLLKLAYHSVRKRMADLLIQLSSKSGSNNLNYLNLSRENLAAMAGIATETVSRILGDFTHEGLIAKTSTQLEILNLDKLKRIRN